MNLTRLPIVDRSDLIVTRLLLTLPPAAVALTSALALWPGSSLVIPLDGPSSPAGGLILPAGVEARHSGELLVRIAAPTLGERLASCLPGLLAAALMALVAVQLWRVLGAAISPEPFGRQAGRQLTIAGMVMTLGGLMWPFVEGLSRGWVVARLGLQGMPLFSISLSALWPVLPGMCVLLLGQAFNRGQDMRDELEGLV